MQTEKTPCWFLGANAPKGYYSKFDQLFAAFPKGKCFLLKGGPGTGKSTMLKKINSVLNKKGLSTELIYCSADINSLDAVITSEGKITALDATSPHTVEPKYPGAYETTVNLSDCWKEEVLHEHAEEIITLFDKNRKLHEEARRYISAAAVMLEEVNKVGTGLIDAEKTAKAALHLCRKEFGKKGHKQGSEKFRFISAITEKGVFFFNQTAKMLCEKIYVINDDWGAASRVFMSTVRKTALEHGLDIITCRCPVFPNEKVEHIFIPKLKLGFMTENKRHKLKITPYRTLHARRFIKKEESAAQKIRIRFALKEAARLLEEAANCVKEAKTVHDELESFYIPAMDFAKVEAKLEEVISEIE